MPLPPSETHLTDAPATSARALEVDGLRVVLGEQTALRGISFSVPAGSVTALIGPNGAGKSTLLRVLAGLLRPASGQVLIGGRSLASDPWRVRRSVGLVAHQPMVYPELTAAENLSFYARLYGLDQVASRVEAGLRRVDLLNRANDRAGALSRGMLQRLALARALLHEPPLLLLDEAEAGLDVRAYELLLAVLRQDAARRTVLFASHDLGFVHETADRVIFLRNGRVAQTVETAGRTVADLQELYTHVLAAPSRPAATPVDRPLATDVGSDQAFPR